MNIAYQVVGQGLDLIVVPGFVSHLDLMWTDPGLSRFIRRVASFSRVILFDMPGTGVSIRVQRSPSLDERVRVIRSVLDAAGLDRAALLGLSEGGQASILFAAMSPARANALILYATYPKLPPRATCPRFSEATLVRSRWRSWPDASTRSIEGSRTRLWTAGERAGRSTSSRPRRTHSWSVASGRCSSARRRVADAARALREFDVTEVLPTIHVPTLVLHPIHDPAVPVELGRYLARKIPGATLVETQGAHHGFFFGEIAAELRM